MRRAARVERREEVGPRRVHLSGWRVMKLDEVKATGCPSTPAEECVPKR